MAQGAVKPKAPKVPKKPKQTGPSTGNRVIKPKKAALIKQNNMKKVQNLSWFTMWLHLNDELM